MRLIDREWKEFKIKDLFGIRRGSITSLNEIDEGTTPIVSASGSNEGIDFFGDVPALYNNNITISMNGVNTGFTAYHGYDFNINVDCCVLIQKFTMNAYIGEFIATIIGKLRYRYSYGRKMSAERIMKETIKLPVDSSGNPDWQFMEDYIKSLHHKPLTTKNKPGQAPELNMQNWKYFLLKDICDISMGNKMDAAAMTNNDPKVNFVGRSADDNGVAGKVDIVIDNKGNRIEPYPAGCITVALGGSLGSTYLQKESFYTSQNVSVLRFDSSVPDGAKLFLCTLICNESRYKYFPFGRELNTHIRNDFGFTIPVTVSGNPDWQFMENYIKALPYGDRLP